MLNAIQDKNTFFINLCNSTKKVVWLTGCKILNDEHLAYDVVQETFLGILKKLDLLMSLPNDEVNFYVLSIAKKNAYAIYRKAKKYVIVDIDEVEKLWYENPLNDADEGISEKAIQKDEVETAYEYLKEVPFDHRTIIVMRAYHDMRFKEIGQCLGISEDNARAIYHRAIKKLQKEVERGEGQWLERL